MISRDLSIDFLGVHFGNPFCLSSSPVGNCYEMCSKAYDAGWGGIVFKTIGPKSFLIDEVSPRFAELTKEGTPFVGFKNMEQIAEHPLEQNLDDLAKLKKAYPDKVLIASIMGPDAEDWTELARLVTEAGADMIEMNLSCPQMTSHAMGSDVGTNPELCREYCAAVKQGTKLPVLAKMTPNITDMVPVAKACMEGGADGIAAISAYAFYDCDLLDEILDILVDTVCSTRKMIRIGGEDYPKEVVKSRLLKLDSGHIEYVISSLHENTTKVRNIRAYLLTSLYNAPTTINSYYTALVNHDMYGSG